MLLYLEFEGCTPIIIPIKVIPLQIRQEISPELTVSFDKDCLVSASIKKTNYPKLLNHDAFPQTINFIESVIELTHGKNAFKDSSITSSGNFMIFDNTIKNDTIEFSWTNVTSKCCSNDHFCCNKIIPGMINATKEELHWNNQTTDSFRNVLQKNDMETDCIKSVVIDKFLDKYRLCAMVEQDIEISEIFGKEDEEVTTMGATSTTLKTTVTTMQTTVQTTSKKIEIIDEILVTDSNNETPSLATTSQATDYVLVEDDDETSGSGFENFYTSIDDILTIY